MNFKKLLLVSCLMMLGCSSCYADIVESKVESTKSIVKTKNNITDVVFILDKSGSMYGLELDTIGGFNSIIEKQKANEAQDVYISCVLFNDKNTVLYDRVDIKKIKPMTKQQYVVGGTTALLDAVGSTMNRLDNVYNELGDKKPSKVMYVIITDGQENASHEYSQATIKKMIEDRKTKLGYEYLFLGANIDAVKVAGQYGIDSHKAVRYHNDKKGLSKSYNVLWNVVNSYVKEAKISEDWASEVKEDYESRK